MEEDSGELRRTTDNNLRGRIIGEGGWAWGGVYVHTKP